MRNPAWAPVRITGALIVASTLAVTACGHASPAGSSAGGAYGTPVSSMPATSSASAGAAQTVALKTETTRAGTVLASSGGLTLYYYGEDKPGSGKSACTGACASAWPPLAAPVRAPAGVRLPGPLGMITRPGGATQVTINGYLVYTYSGDKAPGQQRHQGRLARHQDHGRLTGGRPLPAAGRSPVSALLILAAQFGLEQVHGLEEGGLLARGQLVEHPRQRPGRAVQPLLHQRALSRGDPYDRPPPVRGIRLPFHQFGPVQVGDDAADRGQCQVQP